MRENREIFEDAFDDAAISHVSPINYLIFD